MKLLISTDIEGCAGVALTYETHKNEAAHREFAEQMTREVVAACEAAHEAGADKIVVKNSHGDTADIDPFCMSDYMTLIRGKSGHPYNMMSNLDDPFDRAMCIRYHAPAGSPGFAISHTSTGNSLYIHLNGSYTNELMLNSYTAAPHGVPMSFLSGDRTICDMAREMVPTITMTVTKAGLEAFTYCRALEQMEESIRQGVRKAVAGSLFLRRVTLSEIFTHEVACKSWKKVYQVSFYPEMKAIDTFTSRPETSGWMDVVTVHCFVVHQNVKEITAMDIGTFGKISDVFDPSESEEEMMRTVAGYYGKYQVENDAMNNLYVRMSDVVENRLVVQLDAHLDECGSMAQCIHDNDCLGILILGGLHLTSLSARMAIIKTRADKKIRGVVMSKPVHFMNDKRRASLGLCIEDLYVDIGVVSRREVGEGFGVSIGDPMVPEVPLFHDGEHGFCFGGIFDNRTGHACTVDTMNKVYDGRNELAVDMVGAFAAQEEVDTRDATVITQVVKPDLAILLEGSPSDDLFSSVTQAQGRMKNGVQVHHMDESYISNPVFMEYAIELADRFGIWYQGTVGRGGSTNVGRISLIGKAVPVLVLGVPSRHVYSHYNFRVKDDLETATELAAQIIRGLDPERIRHILRQDIL